MKTIKIKLSDIKISWTDLKVSESAKKMAKAFKEKYDVNERIIVHEETLTLIAGYREYLLAKERGDAEVEVLTWNIPHYNVRAAQILFNGSELSMAEKYHWIKWAMKHFSFKTSGPGAELRMEISDDDKGLADFIAPFFGLNRTDLFRLLKVGERNPALLNLLETKEITIAEAEQIVEESTDTAQVGAGKPSSGGGNQKPTRSKAEQFEKVEKVEDLTSDELNVLQILMVDLLRNLRAGEQLPNGCFIERVWTHYSKKSGAPRRVDHLAVITKVDGVRIQVTISFEDKR